MVLKFYGQVRGQLFRKTALLPLTSEASIHRCNVMSNATITGEPLKTCGHVNDEVYQKGPRLVRTEME